MYNVKCMISYRDKVKKIINHPTITQSCFKKGRATGLKITAKADGIKMKMAY